MATFLKDLIDIPVKVHRGDFVLKLSEGVQRAEQTLADYVVTPQLKVSLKDALSFVHSAVTSNSSKMTYLNGSFGSGKSHFMAVLNLVLQNHPSARAKADLQELCAENPWTGQLKFLMIPFHMIGATNLESAILGGYVEHVRHHHPQAPVPAVYLAGSLFKDAEGLRQKMGDEAFFRELNAGESDDGDDDDGLGDYSSGWDAPSYEDAVAAPAGDPDRDRLIGDLITRYFESYSNIAAGNAEAFVSLDHGLSVISRHAKSLGYDAIILFLDELILWLASRAANLDFVHQEGQKLAKLVEAQEASRPIPLISFVAKQRSLKDLVGEDVTGSEKFGFEETLRHSGGRFHNINLEDSNLPEIIAKRILKPKDQSAADRIDDAFNTTSKMREESMKVLLTARGDREMFRKVYPFSPALVDTLVAVSGALQRNRTALKAMVDLLSRQRDELTLGKVIPVGDLFDIVAHGEDVFISEMRDHFNNARALYHERFLPILEETYGIVESQDLPLQGDEPAEMLQRAERFRNDARLVKTLLLSALVSNVESLKGLTAGRLAALNHGTIKSPIPGQESSLVLKKVRAWASEIGELRILEGENPTISLALVGIDTDRILRTVENEDRPGNRKTKLRDLVLEATGIEQSDLFVRHRLLWKGTDREFPVEFANVREKSHESLRSSGDGWRLIIDYPFDEKDFGPTDDAGRLNEFRRSQDPTRTLVWLPSFFSTRTMNELGRLICIDHVLSNADRFKEAAKHLSPENQLKAKALLENQQSALKSGLLRKIEMAYGIAKADPDTLNGARSLELHDQFQSLWPGFEPRPPVGPNLLEALNNLLSQVLEHDYPAHPAFPVEDRITTSMVTSVWVELSNLTQHSDGRLEVAKTLRSRVRSIAGPLLLGEMAETHFVASRHWNLEFEKKMLSEKLTEPTVGDLYRWIDDPKPTGLPKNLRDLIVIYFAARTNRTFVLHGRPLTPAIDKLPAEARLIQQSLPSDSDWSKAQEVAKGVFGSSGVGPLSTDYLTRFAQSLKEAVGARQEAVASLPGALSGLCTLVGAVEGEHNPRDGAAREVRDLQKVVLEAKSPQALVEGLAQFSPSFTLPELWASWRTSKENLEACHLSSRNLYEMLRDGSTDEGGRLLAKMAEVLGQHEFVTPLAPVLRASQETAWEIVKRPKSTAPSSTVPAPPKKVGAKVVGTRSGSGAGADEVKAAFAELQRLLQDGRKVDFSWTVWEG